MKRVKIDFFTLFAVMVCVLGSALLLRGLLSGSLEAYSNKVQTGAQAERIRTPLQEAEEDPGAVVSGAETDPADGLSGSPMEDETYRAGFYFAQQADYVVQNTISNRYGEWPLNIVKYYLEYPDSMMGNAWFGAAEMPDGTPVMFYYNGLDEVWTMRLKDDVTEFYLRFPTEKRGLDLQSTILYYLQDYYETGWTDWDN